VFLLPSGDRVRLFAGIEIDENVRRGATAIAESLRAASGNTRAVRWVRAENLHITLWFFGEVNDSRAASILQAFDPPFLVPPFEMHVAGLGQFPPSGAARTLWLGVLGGADSIARLHAATTERLRPLGFEPERRRFSPHLTLARVERHRAGPGQRDLPAGWRDLPADAGSCRTTAVTLFRSTLSAKGAVYEPLVRVPLI
jgi:2'-5' RNA ligase